MSELKEKKVHITDLHFDNHIWSQRLAFYKIELISFQKRLDEVASKNTDNEMKVEQSHLQNQITIQNEQLDILLHDLKMAETALGAFAKEHPIAIDHQLFIDHKESRERIEAFDKIYADFKAATYRFVSVWM